MCYTCIKCCTQQIGAKNIYLIGQSYGGLLAQIVARRHPNKIKGLILSGTCFLSGDISFEGMRNIVDICKDDISTDYLVHMDMLLGDLATEFGSHKPEDFEKFDNEVLIFFSKEDTIFCDNLKDALVRIMPNPVVIPDLKGGHLALLSSFDEYVSTLNTFLAERNV